MQCFINLHQLNRQIYSLIKKYVKKSKTLFSRFLTKKYRIRNINIIKEIYWIKFTLLPLVRTICIYIIYVGDPQYYTCLHIIERLIMFAGLCLWRTALNAIYSVTFFILNTRKNNSKPSTCFPWKNITL